MSEFDPSATLITRVSKQMHSPIITVGLIISIITATVTFTVRITDIEASVKQGSAKDAANHLTAMESIQHEEDMRMLTSSNVSENVDEVKEDVQELKDQLKEDSKETQRLLRELIQRQSAPQ